MNGRGGWYWAPSPHSHHPHTAAPNPPAPPTSVRLPPRLPTHSPPDCRRGNNLQPNQHNVFSNNEFPSVALAPGLGPGSTAAPQPTVSHRKYRSNVHLRPVSRPVTPRLAPCFARLSIFPAAAATRPTVASSFLFLPFFLLFFPPPSSCPLLISLFPVFPATLGARAGETIGSNRRAYTSPRENGEGRGAGKRNECRARRVVPCAREDSRRGWKERSAARSEGAPGGSEVRAASRH